MLTTLIQHHYFGNSYIDNSSFTVFHFNIYDFRILTLYQFYTLTSLATEINTYVTFSVLTSILTLAVLTLQSFTLPTFTLSTMTITIASYQLLHYRAALNQPIFPLSALTLQLYCVDFVIKSFCFTYLTLTTSILTIFTLVTLHS